VPESGADTAGRRSKVVAGSGEGWSRPAGKARSFCRRGRAFSMRRRA
jgi:hypothetical protein